MGIVIDIGLDYAAQSERDGNHRKQGDQAGQEADPLEYHQSQSTIVRAVALAKVPL